MPKNKKADRIKFVKAVYELLKKEKIVRKPVDFPVKWRRWEVNEKISLMLEDESEHQHAFTVFIRFLDSEKNYKANGKCNFHDPPGDVDLSIGRFERHFKNVLENF